MAERCVCLDTSVVVAYLIPEQRSEEARELVRRLLEADDLLVAPSWSWAEVGSVLRKKVRARHVRAAEAATQWQAFLALPIDFVDGAELRSRTWEIAERFDLPTLYDAGFLACTELGPGRVREFWTTDQELLRSLGRRRPEYVRLLGDEGVPRPSRTS